MAGQVEDELREGVVEIVLAAGDHDATQLTDLITVMCKAPRPTWIAAVSANPMEVFDQYGTTAMSGLIKLSALLMLSG